MRLKLAEDTESNEDSRNPDHQPTDNVDSRPLVYDCRPADDRRHPVASDEVRRHEEKRTNVGHKRKKKSEGSQKNTRHGNRGGNSRSI